MKIQKIRLIWRISILASLMLGGAFFINKSFVYAEDDGLLALQKDVLAAKQQQAGFESRAQRLEVLGDSKSLHMQKEAETLISELAKQGAPSVDSKEIASNQKIVFPSPRSFETKPGLEPKKTWVFNPMPKFLGFNRDDTYQLTDGKALYKVAVSDGKITVREAVNIGLANSIQAQALSKKIEVANAKWTEAKRALFPTVQFQYEDNGGRDPSTGNNRALYKGRNIKANLTQPVYYGGELVLTAKQAEENFKAAKMEYQKAKNELVQQIRTAYYSVVKTEYNVQYQNAVLKDVAALYKTVKSAHDQGYIAEVDALSVESQYQQANFTVDSTHNDLLAAYLTLRQAMNLDSTDDLPLDLKLELKKISPNFSQLLELALKNNPDILAKELAFLSARDGVEIYKAKKKPHFDFRGSFGRLGEHRTDSDSEAVEEREKLPQRREWYAGIHGSMPFGANSGEFDMIKHQYGNTISAFQGSTDWRRSWKFNLLDKFSDITDEKDAAAKFLQSEADWQKSRNDAIFKLKDNFYSLQKALIQMDTSVAKIRYQEKQNAILKYTMSFQEATPGNYLEGLIEQASNRFAFIQAVTDYHLAVSNIGVTCGDPFYFDKEENK